jgi:hypothetical protein
VADMLLQEIWEIKAEVSKEIESMGLQELKDYFAESTEEAMAIMENLKNKKVS